MITKIDIGNFKCLDNFSLPLSRINVLAGLNGMGKSTCLQSLLLLRQSAQQLAKPLSQIVRNGPLTVLGTPRDLLWEGAADDTLHFGLHTGEAAHRWKFPLNEDEGEFLAAPDNPGPPGGSALFSDQFQYLGAERWGPRTHFPISNAEVRIKRQLGSSGEHAPYFLSKFASEKVAHESLRHPKADSDQLKHQTEAWLGEISPGTRLYTESHEDLDLVSLQFAFTSESGETNHYRSTNTGFGISYTLPVILAVLSSRPSGLLLLENPEAHLHPRGQRRMAELVARAAAAGVQVIVETHSDHFLNGLRLAVHDNRLPPEDVALHFFERETTLDAIRAKVTSPKLDSAGRLDHWPDGFFDENEKALRELLRPPKS